MKIVIVEDDYIQGEFMISELKDGLSVTPILISTESEFNLKFKEISKNKPDVIILDVMLEWAKLTKDSIDVPVEVLNDGKYSAGFRCLRQILKDLTIKNTPIILYTNLVQSDLTVELSRLPSNVYFYNKQSDLISIIKRVVKL